MSTASRHNFATRLLSAAAFHASECTRLEAALAGKGDPVVTDHTAHATSAVINAFTFVEALVNELFSDVADDLTTGRAANLSPVATSAIKTWWNDPVDKNWRKASVEDKVQAALQLAGVSQFDTSKAPYQDFALLVRARNELIHFRPETVAHGSPTKVERMLKAKFPENALMAGFANPYFPDKFLGAGAANWAVSTVRALANEWSRRLALNETF